MKKAIVGYTGFVGSNICASEQFDELYNSKNINDSYGSNPDILVYAGLRAEKYLANSFPEKDYELIQEAERNIYNINPKKLILISTIDVYKKPIDVYETDEVDTVGLQPYGLNRYKLEKWARNSYPECTIVRLPALFGKNIKKNFIYDFINIIPSMLNNSKMTELSYQIKDLDKYYEKQENGFYKLKNLSQLDKSLLKEIFKSTGFTALNFTDSRNEYQFYNLANLWKDIKIAIENDVLLINMSTEPISVSELYSFLTNDIFDNEINKEPIKYNFRSMYSKLYKSQNGYLYMKEEILKNIKSFITKEKNSEVSNI